jgi:hypothetical protein
MGAIPKTRVTAEGAIELAPPGVKVTLADLYAS